MIELHFEPDAQLTPQDRLVLEVLRRGDNGSHTKPSNTELEISDDSDDSTVKHTEFVSPSPEGMLFAPNSKSISSPINSNTE
jgi:hypothetical protein